MFIRHPHKKGFFWSFALTVMLLSGCTKLVEVNLPVTSTDGATIFRDDVTATAVLTGLYTNMSGSLLGGNTPSSLSLFAGLSADELTLFSAVTAVPINAYYKNNLTNNNLTGGAEFWSTFYPIVYKVNAAIEGLTVSSTLTPAIQQQLLGESKFLRAFSYFYLVNLYGKVPVVTGTDFTINAALSRAEIADVWEQIITDLTEAQSLLSDHFLDGSLTNPTTERVRPSKAAATALLARAYLYTGAWDKAEEEATSLITSSSFSLVNDLNSVFLANSNEAIWQLQPVNAFENTPDAQVFVLTDMGPSSFSNPVYLSEQVAESFEAADQRRINWVDSVIVEGVTYRFPYKYKVREFGAPVTEYEIVLRLAEQYLIRAEARAQQDNFTGAAEDLDVIRNRAGLADYSGAQDKPSLLAAILHERQVELFTEFGHRWLDLKRTGRVDDVMNIVAPLKGGSWDTHWQYYPLQVKELESGVNLEQTEGY